jgi:FMN-dependent NADH-azoreductase
MKLFIDRTYCFLTPDFHTNPERSRLSPGKKVVFIQTQGLGDDAVFADVFPRYRGVMQFIGINEAHLIRACGVAKRDDIYKHEDVLKQAEELAAKIMGEPKAT